MITEKELQVLKLLRGNARMTVTEIAHKVDLPRSTVYEKIKKFKQEGIINKYSCLINFNQLGLPIQVNVLFKADAKDRIKLGEALAYSNYTNDVTKLGNDFDFMASFIFSSMDDLHNYLDELSAKFQIKDSRIFYISKELKREEFAA